MKWKQSDFSCSDVITPKLGLMHLSALNRNLSTCQCLLQPPRRCADITVLGSSPGHSRMGTVWSFKLEQQHYPNALPKALTQLGMALIISAGEAVILFSNLSSTSNMLSSVQYIAHIYFLPQGKYRLTTPQNVL